MIEGDAIRPWLRNKRVFVVGGSSVQAIILKWRKATYSSLFARGACCHTAGRYWKQVGVERVARSSIIKLFIEKLQIDRYLLVLFYFCTLVLSSFWTGRGHRCSPFSPPVLASIFIAQRV